MGGAMAVPWQVRQIRVRCSHGRGRRAPTELSFL